MLAGGAILLAAVFLCQPPMGEWEFATAFMITVDEHGDASWAVERRVLLESREAIEAFDEYASEFKKNVSSYLREFEERMMQVVERASVITGRSMEATGFSIAVERVQAASGNYGVIRYEFEWKSFARVEDGKLVIGDVFEGGFYLSRDDTLVIRVPPQSTIEVVIPPQDQMRDGELIWYGRRDFGAGEPKIVVALAKVPASLAQQLRQLLPYMLAAFLTALVALILLRKRRRPLTPSDAHQLVIELLQRHDGALPQSKIVELTGFSKAKVSMIVSSLEKQGIVYRRKLGRQNMVYLR